MKQQALEQRGRSDVWARPSLGPLLQRKCGCGQHTIAGGECDACGRKKQKLQRRAANRDERADVPEVVHDVLRSPSSTLDAETRSFMESRFNHDFSHVRVHTDAQAAESAQAVNALAYTVGRDVVFDTGRFNPHTSDGRHLLAHELTHVVQQGGRAAPLNSEIEISSPTDASDREADMIARLSAGTDPLPSINRLPGSTLQPLQRVCTPAAICHPPTPTPIPGSARSYGTRVERQERRARARRAGMVPSRQISRGHLGHARQLELFLNSQQPGLLPLIEGIFIDMDLLSGAMTADCAGMTPPITGATRPCVFVHGAVNQQALLFNTTRQPTIGGLPREVWRVQTFQMLLHEVQHVGFDTTVLPAPAGITTPSCTRANISEELTELNAILSEFVVVFRAIPAGAPASHRMRRELADWFRFAITNPNESIRGTLLSMGCHCECVEVQAFIISTFNFVTSSWSAAEKNAFNTELRRPRWRLRPPWPL